MRRRLLALLPVPVLLVSLFTPLLQPRLAFADNKSDIKGGSYAFKNQVVILGSFKNIGQVDFSAPAFPSASNAKSGVVYSYYYPPSSKFCSGSIHILGSHPSNTASSLHATVKLGYKYGNSCATVTVNNVSIKNPKLSNSSSRAAQGVLKWSGNNIIDVNCANPFGGYQLSCGSTSGETYTPAQNVARTFIQETNNNSCHAYGVIVLNSKDPASGTYYELDGGINTSSGGTQSIDISKTPIASLFKGKCSGKVVTREVSNVVIAGTSPAGAQPGAGPVSPSSPSNPSGGGGGGGATLDCNVPDVNFADLTSYVKTGLDWVICGVVQGLAGVASFLDNQITGVLAIGANNGSTQPNEIFCGSGTCNAYYGAWQSFRDMALGLLVIAGLVMIISQALGLELLDAYTIRKILPRFLIAALGITLSWPLMHFMVTLSNALGYGVPHLISGPFSSIKNPTLNLSFGDAMGVTIASGIGLAVAGLFGLMLLLGSAVLSMLVAFLVMILRQIVVILLIIVSPIAIVAYILPNTQRVYKMWWDNLIKALLMFPMITALIAAGYVFAWATLASSGASSNIILEVIAFIAYFAPYFMIPATFRFAGAAVGGLGNLVNGRAQGMFQGLRSLRANQRKKRLTNAYDRAHSGKLFRTAPENSRREKFNNLVQGATLIGSAGKNPMRMGDRIRAAREAMHLEEGLEDLEKAKSFQPLKGDDDAGHAIINGHGSRAAEEAYLRSRVDSEGRALFDEETIRQKMAHIDLARKEMGQHSLEMAAILSTVQASTAYGEVDPETGERIGAGLLLRDIGSVSRGNAQTMAQLIGKVKQIAPPAGRPDAVGSFSTMYEQAVAIGNARTPEDQEEAIRNASRTLADETVRIEAAGTILGGKGRAVEAFLPALQRRVARAAESVKTTSDNVARARSGETVTDDSGNVLSLEQVEQQASQADRQYVQVLASTKALHDVAGQISQEKATMIADGLFGQSVPGTNQTVLDAINDHLDDRVFNESRNEYRSNYGRQTSEQQRLQAVMGARPPEGFEPPQGAIPQ